MGNYNPHAPQILGEEWVPIREENLVFNQVINNVELGTTFTTSTSATSNLEGVFYTNQLPTALARNQVWTMAVYPRGAENESGPVGRVLIPVANGGITGSSAAVVLRNSANVQTALFDPSDRRYIEMTLGNSNQIDIALYFDVNKYAQLLVGKRILGVNFLYGGELLSPGNEEGQTAALQTSLRADSAGGAEAIAYPPLITGTNSAFTGPPLFVNKGIARMQIGDTNMFFTPTTGINITQALPWNFAGLSRFDFTNPAAVQFHFQALGVAGTGPHWTMDYASLEIFYCEEKRIAVGSTVFQYGAAATTQNYRLGYNICPLWTPDGASVSLTALSDYTVTLAQGSLGDSPLAFSIPRIGPQPKLNALRELYQVQPQVGVQINIPAPPVPDIVGEVFTSQPTHVLPQLALETAGGGGAGVITQVHPYGRQSVGQVYGSKFVSQRIDDSIATPGSYTQVRYYARRFGNTTVPLTLTGPSSSAFINPAEFDELDPIIDGWKEVTLTLTPPVTMGSTGNPTWVWTAPGEGAGNRWEVLGAWAAAQDGIVGQPLTGLTNLSVATYGTPVSGGQIYETWMPQGLPWLSGATLDTTSDVAVYFSWNPPAITGLSVSTLNQPLSGIGLNCGIAPDFIPTALQYNRITWAANPAYYVADLYARTVTNGWGVATSGQTWLFAAITSGVTPGLGRFTPTSTSATTGQHFATTQFSAYDTQGYVEIASTIAASGAPSWAGLALRADTGFNQAQTFLQVLFETDSTVSLGVTEWTNGGPVDPTVKTPILRSYVLGTKVKLRWQYIGAQIQARIWYDGTDEPDIWQLTDDGIGTDPVRQGFGAVTNRAVGSPVPNFLYSNLRVSTVNNGYVEIQRQDEITDWQTIAKITNMGASGFNDYEARISLQADYRIRYVNVYGFEGPWSPVVSNTIPAPGVTAGGLGPNQAVLVFTTNEVQDGTSNLAYSPAWEGTVDEDFNFPEASAQVFQTMYNRDYVTVFRPEERGGTNFTRAILVQAAAIDPATLEDFTSLRNMAWANVSYICVRDAEGNRWLANVSVPSGSVTHYRKLYMAPVNVVQVTDTPTPVDPSWLD